MRTCVHTHMPQGMSYVKGTAYVGILTRTIHILRGYAITLTTSESFTGVQPIEQKENPFSPLELFIVKVMRRQIQATVQGSARTSHLFLGILNHICHHGIRVEYLMLASKPKPSINSKL